MSLLADLLDDATSSLDEIECIKRTHTLLQSPQVQALIEALESPKTFKEHRLLDLSNTLTVEIDRLILLLFGVIKEVYSKRFPELKDIVSDPSEYAKLVLEIGNAPALDIKNCSLPASTILIIQMTLTQSRMKSLPDLQLKECQQVSRMLLLLSECKNTIYSLSERLIHNVAPNLDTLVGPSVAARLVSIAGGILELSKIPSSNIGLLRTNPGSSPVINNCHLVRNAPKALKKKACKLLASKAALCSRIDAAGTGTLISNENGLAMRLEIEEKMRKLIEPPPMKLIKPLPAPIEETGKRRGGKRFRKMKEKYKVTKLAKMQNRLKFGDVSEPSEDYQTGMEYGMTLNGGNIRVLPEDTQKLGKAAQKKLNSHPNSLTLDSMQGIQLNAPAEPQRKKSKYF